VRLLLEFLDISGADDLAGGGAACFLPIAAVFIFATVLRLVVKVRSLVAGPVTSLSP
jgi:hypothetical protein